MKKRKRSLEKVKRNQAIILKAADALQKAGIATGHRAIVVGGSRPVLVDRLRDKQ